MALPEGLPDLGRPTPQPVSSGGAYLSFALGVGAWFGAWGMQMVLFSWLIVGELQAPAERVGTAQMALVVPALFFLLIAGATADRVDRRRLLIVLHLLAGGLMLALSAAVGAGLLSYPLVIGYALVMGTLAAFVFPARDALLSDVAGSNLMRAVTGVTLMQFGAQALGSFSGGAARYVGTPTALAVQASVVLLGVLALRRLPNTPAPPGGDRSLRLAEVLEGVREVAGSSVLRPVMLLGVGIGLFFMGPYFVVFPLLIRDYYHGDVAQLGLLTTMFPVGTVIASLVLLRRGKVRRKGMALVLAQAAAACCLIAISLGIPFEATLVAGLLWGICGGVFMNTGRTVFQENASPQNRARVLSVYSLGFMGAGSLGSPLAGYLAGALGPLGACAACGGAMLCFVASVLVFTRILSVR